MDLSLQNQVVFISGSSRGIGRGLAESFLEEGARVVISGRQKKTVTSTVKNLCLRFSSKKILPIVADLSKASGINSALKRVKKKWGFIDCLVANVGSGAVKPGWNLSDKDWNDAFSVNFSASVKLIEAVLPDMVKAKKGNVVAISSIVGLEDTGAPLTYTAAKAALLHYLKGLARQVGPWGIRVNSVAPGNIYFKGSTWEKKIKKNPRRVKDLLMNEVPLQRFGTPREIADIVVFLSSPRASFITGSCIVADGGQVRKI